MVEIRYFVARQFCSQIYALLSEKFPGLKISEISGMLVCNFRAAASEMKSMPETSLCCTEQFKHTSDAAYDIYK